MAGLLKEGLSGEYVDYAAAEQATMAASAMLQTMVDDGMISREQYVELFGLFLNDCYSAIEKDEEYNPAPIPSGSAETPKRCPVPSSSREEDVFVER